MYDSFEVSLFQLKVEYVNNFEKHFSFYWLKCAGSSVHGNWLESRQLDLERERKERKLKKKESPAIDDWFNFFSHSNYI